LGYNCYRLTDPPHTGAADDSRFPGEVRRSVELLDSLAGRPAPDEPGEYVWIQTPGCDKYAFPDGVRIDCESRLHLCKAACCALVFPLSEQDIEEGVVRWDPESPYLNARREDGYCQHLAESRQCSIYSQRPVPCRAFDCRNDRRIWLDFERRIVNPALLEAEGPAAVAAAHRHRREQDRQTAVRQGEEPEIPGKPG